MQTALLQSANLSAPSIGLGKSNGFDNKMKAVKMMLRSSSSSSVSFVRQLKGSSNLSFLGQLGIMIVKQSSDRKLDKNPRKTRAVYERFTQRAIEVVVSAKEEAGTLGHNLVGTEMLLLGLIGKGDGMSGKILKSMGINLEDARVEVEKLIGQGGGERADDGVTVEMPWTLGAKRVLAQSLEEVSQLGHVFIGSGHVLLALLREEDAARVLENLGVDPNDIRTQVIGSEEEWSDDERCAGMLGQHLFSSLMI